MYTLQINVLIQFLVPSTCFEHRVFIIWKTICTCSFLWYVFLHLCKSSLADRMMCSILYLTHARAAGTNGLPDDKHTMFETCRGHQELN